MTGASMNGLELYLWRNCRKKWTQAEAAEWYGVHPRTWRRYEQHRARIVPSRLSLRIAELAKIERDPTQPEAVK
jgi:hypothetical protein